MLGRIIHFLIGAFAAAGGGYLVWMHRASAFALFPPAPGGTSWLVVLGVAALSIGIVFLFAAVMPRPQRAARLAAEAARRQEALAAADAFYAERARAADRDWRSGDLPAPAPPQPHSERVSLAPSPAPEPARQEAAPVKPVAAKPVASSVPPPVPASQPFPATATLAPIPRSVDPPAQPVSSLSPHEPSRPQPLVAAKETESYAAIRTAIAEGRLDEAEKMLAHERETAEGEALAELTGLAGDHAAAAGRQSNAKWLWRLALKRFGEAGAMSSPPARAVAERLRLSDQ